MIHIVCNDVVAASLQVSHLKDKDDFVCSAELLLPFGRLDESYDSQYRRELFTQMFAYESPDVFTSGVTMDDYFDKNVNSIHTMLSRTEMGEPVLILADADVNGVCSLALVCSLFNKANKLGQIYILECPRTVLNREYFAKCKGWEVLPQDGLQGYLQYKRELDTREIKYYTELWERLTRENTTLRAVVSGAVLSVADDFYDPLILKYVMDKPQSENCIIGDLLSDTNLEVDSLLWFWRIEELVKMGKIEVVQNAHKRKNFPARKIRKT